MISEDYSEGLNQVPFNSLKNLQIKATFVANERAILVFDLRETVVPVAPETSAQEPQTHVMTSTEALVSAEVDVATNAVKVRVLPSGDIVTITTDPEKAAFVGKLVTESADDLSGLQLFWTTAGQITSVDGLIIGSVMLDGKIVTMLTDLEQKIATLTGSGSEIVITGEKPEFLDSMDQLQVLNAQQNLNPQWVPVTDLKISNLGSVLQIEFRNSVEEESFSLFKLVSPLVVNQIMENKAKN